MNINEFLCRHYRISSEESIRFLQEQEVLINGKRAVQRQHIDRDDGLTINGKIIRSQEHFVYYAFYKPRGIECTLNVAIADNLMTVLPFQEHVYPIGRLDKESEGLLILTNDGRLYKDVALAERGKEKEYEVEVAQVLTPEALRKWTEGMVIKGQKTRSARVVQVDEHCFRIVLTQGINRQIRRMCYKLGYDVMRLKRLRITSVELEGLKPGEYRVLNREDII